MEEYTVQLLFSQNDNLLRLGTTNEKVWDSLNKMTEEYNTSVDTLKTQDDTNQKRVKSKKLMQTKIYVINQEPVL